jgi:predicted TIM-barrel enzyme
VDDDDDDGGEGFEAELAMLEEAEAKVMPTLQSVRDLRHGLQVPDGLGRQLLLSIQAASL